MYYVRRHYLWCFTPSETFVSLINSASLLQILNTFLRLNHTKYNVKSCGKQYRLKIVFLILNRGLVLCKHNEQ